MADTYGQVASTSANRNPFNYEKIEQINRDLATNWLTLDEITNQLNLFGDESQDPYLENLELAVRMHIEDYLGMPIFPISYRVYYGVSSQYNMPMNLDLPEVSQGGVTINSVKFYTAGSPSVLQTIAPINYYYDATGNKVIVSSGVPSNVSLNRTSPIVVEYTVTPSFIAQYPVIKQAALLLLTHLYNNRSATESGKINPGVPIPLGFDALLRPYKPLVM